MITKDKYFLKSPHDMTPKLIVIHNTANVSSAKSEVAYMLGNTSPIGFHYAIDENEVIQAIPEERNTWHAGDGENGYANRNAISIEICRSTHKDRTLFLKAQERTAVFVAQLLNKYNWDISKVKKHNDFNKGTSCPHATQEYGWSKFLADVQRELDNMKNEKITEDWKLDGLKLLASENLVDYTQWVDKLDEPMPTWAVMTIMARIVKMI